MVLRRSGLSRAGLPGGVSMRGFGRGFAPNHGSVLRRPEQPYLSSLRLGRTSSPDGGQTVRVRAHARFSVVLLARNNALGLR
mmetsp:Transcript_6233/g.12318  ORF Transcript_6233/g.12318 Transcript_6233/m.12318 type:complete len:82 (-) Transcript_6233:414-659(-)